MLRLCCEQIDFVTAYLKAQSILLMFNTYRLNSFSFVISLYLLNLALELVIHFTIRLNTIISSVAEGGVSWHYINLQKFGPMSTFLGNDISINHNFHFSFSFS